MATTIGQARELDLPPGFEAVSLRELGDAFAHARSIAAEKGAGTMVHVRRFDQVELAVVLEPEEPLATARRALYAVMNAMGDAIAAHCPPEKPLTFDWPDTIRIDGGILGGARLAWPAGAREEAPPDWLVAGLTIRAVVPLIAPRPGGHVLDQPFLKGTSLEIEGFEMLDGAALVASFARHLMVHFDTWREKGFVPVGQHYLARLLPQKGVKRGIDGNGDLLERTLRQPKEPQRRALIAALATPGWIDPASGEIWL
jgi:hypothetical protein